jgi:colanic acid/amylovoran biosynthesis glycosyltransferase
VIVTAHQKSCSEALAPERPSIRVGYVISRYPAPSHAFIQREIAEVVSRGAQIIPVSLRSSSPAELLTDRDHRDFAITHALLPVSIGRAMRCHLSALGTRPRAYARTILYAVGGARGLEERARRLSHFHQAILLWHVARRTGIRHFHAHFERPSADVAMLAARFAGGVGTGWSWSFTAHSPQQYLSDERGLIRKVTNASFVVCISHFGRSQLMNLVRRELWVKLRVIHIGLDAEEFSADHRPRGAGRTIVSVARLVPLKGHAVLFEAIARLRHEGLPTELILVGDGSERPALMRLAQDLGIGDSVVFAGAVGQDRIKQHYAAADVVCLASFVEGVPVVLMEAMAMGVPVVATRIAGIPELVVDNGSGVLVDAGSSDDLADGLRSVLTATAERRAEMGATGRARVEHAFRADVAATLLLDLFRSVTMSSSSGSG